MHKIDASDYNTPYRTRRRSCLTTGTEGIAAGRLPVMRWSGNWMQERLPTSATARVNGSFHL